MNNNNLPSVLGGSNTQVNILGPIRVEASTTFAIHSSGFCYLYTILIYILLLLSTKDKLTVIDNSITLIHIMFTKKRLKIEKKVKWRKEVVL